MPVNCVHGFNFRSITFSKENCWSTVQIYVFIEA
uniref:Uncharacterized protein n=1 Tax=Arundo donax TaxID=35708 RepID=A0A0A9H7P0_ARUDO